jgi:hypothetical protein
MRVDDQHTNTRRYMRFALPIGPTRMKAIFFLLFAMVTLSLGASAFELSTRTANACTIKMICN